MIRKSLPLYAIALGLTLLAGAIFHSVNPAAIAAINAPDVGCDKKVFYDAAVSGNIELVPLVAGEVVFICGYTIRTGATAADARLVYGTGTACATGETGLTGVYQFTTYDGIAEASPSYRGMKTARSNALCIETSGAIALDAIVYYAQF